MIYEFDEFQLDADRMTLMRAGRVLPAALLVLKLLHRFVRSAGELVTKRELLDSVWGGHCTIHALSAAVVRLRRTLSDGVRGREFVVTESSRGYRFVRPVIALAPLSPSPALPTLPPISPFVGRVRVLALLRAALCEARAGRGGVCILDGDLGIGKTRVAEVLSIEALSNEDTVVWAYCQEADDVPALWPVRQWLRGLIRTLHLVRSDLPRGICELVGTVARSPDTLDPSKHAVFEGFLELTKVVSARATCLLVVDELSCADESSLELLRYCLDVFSSLRLLVIATTRDRPTTPKSAREHLGHIRSHRNTLRVALTPLLDADVSAYVSALVQDRTGSIAEQVCAKSEGNPYLMTELVREFHSQSRVIDLSYAARELAWKRLGTLSPAGLDVLGWAAVAGRNFSLALLRGATGRDAHALMCCLDEALEHAVITTHDQSRLRFAFSHDALRRVLYDSLGIAERHVRHLGLARALEAHAAAGGAVDVCDLARHMGSALPDSDPGRTIEYCREAADSTVATRAYAHAEQYVEHALQALALVGGNNRSLRLQLRMQHAFLVRNRSAVEAEPLLRDLIAQSRSEQAYVPMALAALLLNPNPGFPVLSGASETLRDALDALPDTEEELQAIVSAQLVLCTPAAYDVSLARRQLEHACKLASTTASERASLAVRIARLYSRSLMKNDSGDDIDALTRACEASRSLSAAQPAMLEIHRAIDALQSGRRKLADDSLARAELLCRKQHFELHWHIKRFQALSLFNAGAAAAAEVVLRDLYGEPAAPTIGGSMLFRAHDELLVFNPSNASHRCDLQLEPEDPPGIWALKVRILAAAGQHKQATLALRSIPVGQLDVLPHDRDYLGTLGSLARAARHLNAMDYIEALYELLSPHETRFAAHLSFLCEGSVPQLLGELAFALGRHSRARAHLEEGIRCCERAGFIVCAAQGRTDLKGWYKSAKRH